MASFSEPAALTDSTATVPSRSLTWRRGSCVFTFLCIGCLFQGATYCHMTAFFDRYAQEEKELSSTQYGIIMGSYCFVMVFLQPLTAKVVTLKVFDDKTILLFGWLVDATFCLIMSFVYKLGRGFPFFIGCLIVRVLEASGSAVGFIMLYVVTGLELNEINHIVIPLIDTVYGLSVVVGPALSGFLFDFGGFPMPFRVMGGSLMIATILALCLLPKPRALRPDEIAPKDFGISAALKPQVIVNVLCTLNAFILVSSNEATLALQMHVKFGMGASESGLLFLYAGCFYALSSLLLGFLSKKITDPRYFVLFGQLVSLVALALQGPLIPIEQTKGIVILAQILIGFGAGPAFVCSYIQSLRYISRGKETKEMYAALSSVFSPASSGGCALGPLIAGMIRHYFSYETVIAANAAQTLFMSVLLIIMILQSDETPEDTKHPTLPLSWESVRSPENDLTTGAEPSPGRT